MPRFSTDAMHYLLETNYLFLGSYWFLIVLFMLLCHRRAFKKFYADFLDYQAPVEDFYIEWQLVLLVITYLDSWLDRET